MAVPIDTNSLNWAELIEWMEADSDLPSECAGKKANKTERKPVRDRTQTKRVRDKNTETKPIRCKQIADNDLRNYLTSHKDLRNKIISDFDLRKKINKNRSLESGDGLLTTTPKSKNQARSNGNMCTQGMPTNDLRKKLHRDREETGHDGSKPQQEKNKYTERHGGLSPLRSPIDRSKQNTIFDIDNSQNFRFTKNREAASQKLVTALRNGEKKSDHKCMLRSPSRSNGDKFLVRSGDIIYTTPNKEESESKMSDGDRETPGHSLTPRQNSRHSWSRRKLLLPSEGNGHEDGPTERIPEPKEDDEIRLARREKDIVFGKNTPAYQLYISEVPVRERVMRVHPRTPDKFRKCSRRSWESQIKIWKRKLHAFAAEFKQDRDLISDILQETHLRVDDSCSESKTDDEDFLNILDEDTIDLLDTALITENTNLY